MGGVGYLASFLVVSDATVSSRNTSEGTAIAVNAQSEPSDNPLPPNVQGSVVDVPAVTKVMYLSTVAELTDRDQREIDLLELSLKKTVDEYGPYELVPAPRNMTISREFEVIKEGRHDNYIRSFGFEPKLADSPELVFAKFPLYRGVLSYRVCFVSKDKEEIVAKAANESLEALQKFTFGQGLGWVDARILEHNGFRVREVRKYESLFEMTAINRVDLFCRGMNELLPEAIEFSDIENLSHDKSFALYYPLSLVFVANKNDEKLIKRVEKGLLKAFNDGSYQEIWDWYFEASVEFVGLEKRKIYKLKNHLLRENDINLEPYFYQPKGM